MPLDNVDPSVLEQELATKRQRWAHRRRVRAARLGLVRQSVASGLATVITDAAGIAGIGLVSYGAWLAWQPAGFMVGGALLLGGAWLAGSRE